MKNKKWKNMKKWKKNSNNNKRKRKKDKVKRKRKGRHHISKREGRKVWLGWWKR